MIQSAQKQGLKITVEAYPSDITRINPGGAGTNWCGLAFVAKFSADLTLADLK
jgi:hypothetical protein